MIRKKMAAILNSVHLEKASAAASNVDLNISVDFTPRLLKSNIWMICKKSIFSLKLFLPRLIRLISLIDN